MKSRYGIWILSVCWIGLAGCANWQNRVNNTGGPGTAATFTAGSADPMSPGLAAPGTAFNEPPPPMPPPVSDPSMTLGPIGGPPPQRLDLSSAEPAAAAPAKMYNLDSSAPAPKKQTSASKPASANTITKLASKAKPAASAPKAAQASAPSGSAIERLSAKTRPASSQGEALPKPNSVAAKAEPGSPQPKADPAVDTTFLAQPVRKGSSGESSSKGPQSSAIPSDNKLLYGTSKPAIYPVSNPAIEEPVDTMQFS